MITPVKTGDDPSQKYDQSYRQSSDDGQGKGYADETNYASDDNPVKNTPPAFTPGNAV